jgi:hypothetical protein
VPVQGLGGDQPGTTQPRTGRPGTTQPGTSQHGAGLDWAGLDWAVASLSYAWPGLPATVTVLAGEVRTLPPVTVWPTDLSVLVGTSAPVRPASSVSRTGSIAGRVTGAGPPLRGICAIAVPDTFSNRHGPLPRAATTRDGTYRIAGLRPGRYLVLFRTGLRSCPSDANWLPQWYPDVNSPFATGKAVEVRVRAGRETGDIDGRLKLGAEITGITHTRSGRPVRGICVNLYNPFTFWGPYIVGSAATSGKTGRYALRGLFPGKYQLRFTIGCGTAGNYAQQWWRDRTAPGHASLIKVKSRQIVTGIDARLVPGGAVTGTVRAKTVAAKPLPHVCVYVTDNAGDYANVVTAKNGTYEAEGLNTGKYQVSFDPTCEGFVSSHYLPTQRTVAVTAGHTRSSFDAFLAPAAGLSGVVRNQAGRPVGSVCVNVDDKNNDYAFTNANGTYSISGMVPGRYQVYFEADCQSSGSLADQWYDDQPDSDSADWLTFTAGKTDRNIDVTLHPGGTLAGRLVTTNGQPVKGTCVAVAAPDNVLDWGSFNGATSSHDGHYVISDLTPGEYQVTFECQAGRYASQWFNAQPDSTTADYLAINPGVTTTLNQRVSLAGRITGTVTNPAGHPIGGICVFLANAKNGEFIEPISGGAETARGRYTDAELTPGRYLVQFSDCNGGPYGGQWYRAKNSESFATPVTVRAGQTTASVNATLTLGGSISGIVTGPGGKPANGTCVEAQNLTGQFFSDLFFTIKGGHYSINGLSSGRYALTFSACYTNSPNLASITLPSQIRITAPQPVTGLDFSLAAGGTIRGTVTGQSSPSSPAGPQNRACVVALPTNPDGSEQIVFTDPAGQYRLDGLAAGTYRVELGDPFCANDLGVGDLAPQWYHDQLTEAGGGLVTVTAGHTIGRVNAALRPLGGIDGTVTTRTHTGVTGECVTAVPFHASADLLAGPPSADVAITASGQFQLIDLPAGQYKIEFSVGCGDSGYVTQWWDGAAFAGSATVVTVGAGTVTGIDATLRR